VVAPTSWENTTLITQTSSGIPLAICFAEETHMAKRESDPNEIDPAVDDDVIGAGEDDDFDDDDEDDDLEDDDEEEEVEEA
jgi:hypothetical protein